MKKTLVYILSLVFISITAYAGEYLGNFNDNQYDPNSVSNPYGQYGSQYSPKSINNKYGEYGSKYSNKSAHNPYATNPPKAYDSNGNQSTITTNPYQPNAINSYNTPKHNSLTIYSGDN